MNPYHSPWNVITDQLWCRGLLAFSYMLLFMLSPCCYMPASMSVEIIFPTEGYSTGSMFGSIFPVPMSCSILEYVMSLHCSGGKWDSERFFHGLPNSDGAETHHLQGESWAHVCTNQVKFSLDPTEKPWLGFY